MDGVDVGHLVSTRILQYDGVGDGSAQRMWVGGDVDGDGASGDAGVADWHEEVSLSSPAIGDDRMRLLPRNP